MRRKLRIPLREVCIAYIRESSRSKAYLLENQANEINNYLDCTEENWITPFSEIGNEDSSDLDQRDLAVEAAIEQSKYLIVTEISRFTRDVNYFNRVIDRGLKIFVCRYSDITIETLRRIVINANADIVEQDERNEIAKYFRVIEGQKTGGALADLSYRREASENFARAINPIIRSIDPKGIASNAAIARELNNLGVRTRRDGHWQSTSVKRILELKRDVNLGDKIIDRKTRKRFAKRIKYSSSISKKLAKDAFLSKEQFDYWVRNYLEAK